jgi:hypothetical protein
MTRSSRPNGSDYWTVIRHGTKGHSHARIACALGVDSSTLRQWSKRSPKFAYALEVAHDAARYFPTIAPIDPRENCAKSNRCIIADGIKLEPVGLKRRAKTIALATNSAASNDQGHEICSLAG